MLKGFFTVVAEIVIGIVWCAIMIAATVLVFLVALGVLGWFVRYM